MHPLPSEQDSIFPGTEIPVHIFTLPLASGALRVEAKFQTKGTACPPKSQNRNHHGSAMLLAWLL